MEHAHHCPLCAWYRTATSATILKPTCPRCGGVLRAVRLDELERARREDADTRPVPRRGDASTFLALLLAGPWLLPLIGVHIGDFAFAPAFVLCSFSTGRAAARARHDARRTAVWVALAAAALLAAAASALAVVSAVVDSGGDAGIFYIGALASAALVVAGAIV